VLRAIGAPPFATDKNSVVFAARLAALEEQEETLRAALDSVGNALAVAVATDREEYLANTREAEGDAVEKYAAAITKAQQALSAIANARAALGYLESFDHTRAQHGGQQQFVGGRLTVVYRVPGVLINEWDAATLLEGAAKVTEQ
jgi:hypothetical protein